MRRVAGILMPIASLPSPYGIGTLGKEAYRFADYLCDAGCKLWQVLPLQPTSYGDSPYQSCSANALNPYLIDLDLLQQEGLLRREEYESLDWGDDPRRVDYEKLYRARIPVLRKAFARFDRDSREWRDFLHAGKYRDFALFMAIKNSFGDVSCTEWGELSRYGEEAERFAAEHAEDVDFWQFTQFLFLRQWYNLKAYANARGVEIMGDMPIYVARDSVEMWKYASDLFLLDGDGRLSVQAGVPPDAFSETGQLWGNPVYDWKKIAADGFGWWHRRLDDALSLYDIVRIDHFIGFVQYYCIPEGEQDARHGEWRKGPGAQVFCGYEGRKIVAEDLGIVTDEVRAAIAQTGYPGMRILHYAFDGRPDNEHNPSLYPENCVAYTGTHDNETLLTHIRGMSRAARKTLVRELTRECKAAGVRCATYSAQSICDTILRLMYASKADRVIFPLQDALHIGAQGRFNRPATVSTENWSFRFLPQDFTRALARKWKREAIASGRFPSEQ